MKVAIIGGGAVGLLLASFLTERGIDITVITRREEQAEALNETELLRINIDGSKTTVQLRAMNDYSQLPQFHIVIVTVKYIQLDDVLQKLTLEKQLPAMLFLQNGLLHYEQLLVSDFKEIAFGSVTFGAEKRDDCTVIHRGNGVVNVGVVKGVCQPIKDLLAAYKSEVISFQLIKNAEDMLFQKAFFNCLINPLTFILQVNNGELVSKPHAFMMLKNLYDEMIAVFPEAASITFEQVVALCEKTSLNTSSMLSDRLAGRQTEIETIVGAMIKRAEKLGKDLPTLRTLYHLVLFFEGDDKKR